MGKPQLGEVGELVQGGPAGTEAPAGEAGGRFMGACLQVRPLAIPRNLPS